MDSPHVRAIETTPVGDDDLGVHHKNAINAWWASLTPTARQFALDIEPGDFLPYHVALALTAHGVRVSDVSVCWDVAGVQRAVTASVQPRALTDFLTARRVWAAGWADTVTAVS